MENLVKVIIENTGSTLFIPEGKTLAELGKIIFADNKYIAAWSDNRLKDLSYRIFSPRSIRFVETCSSEGMRIYARSLFFLLQKAVGDVMAQANLRMMHPVGRGFYCEIEGLGVIKQQMVDSIKQRMFQLAEMDLPFVRSKISMAEAIEMYERQGAVDKLQLLETRPQFFVTIYNLAGLNGYFYGAMAPSTGYLRTFDIQPFGEGMVVLMPRKEDLSKVEIMCLQPKLFDIFRQNKEWVKILGVHSVGNLNHRVMHGEGGELIKIGEALQEKNFARIADTIYERGNVRLILIAGPSSSGKTSFSKRLAIQLRVLGLDPHLISMDNYFVDREHTPRDESGNYDFECLEAVDIEGFNQDLNRLIQGEVVELCKFSFHEGKRYFDGQTMQLGNRSIIIVEGIHALNPGLTPDIDDNIKFRIYASALTTLSLDNMNAIPTTDNRLLRRMVRDHKYRSRTAQQTINGWQSVRRGEDKHIFPYQEQADVMFGTSLFFEFPILKKYALPILGEVPMNSPEYAEAYRLISFLNYFVEMSDNELPPNSILREFIGGSSFEY